MAFYGCTFTFDGVSCENFSMMLYNVDSTKQGATVFSTNAVVQEERIANRNTPLFYGATANEPLSFQLVFGLNPDLYSNGASYDRPDFQQISSWLTGRRQYCRLSIDQEDLYGAYYRCFISDLTVLEQSMYPCAFSCTVTCDSPFAYLPARRFSYAVDQTVTVLLRSQSTMNGFYYPKIEIVPSAASDLSICNHTDGGRTFTLSKMQAGTGAIAIDCENKIITCASGANLYQYSNFLFPQLVRGTNQLTLTGSGTFTFICEFPVNIGS